MAEIGFFLSSEEHGPSELVGQARLAEASGFASVLISDHYHPWIDRQGESPFVWSVIGAIAAATRLRVTTGVTCPTMRVHPAVIAQAAATAALLCEGRFALGLGSGEALNEHILGDHWPPAPVRLEMLAEAIEVLRALWTGENLSHRGRHFTVENARIYSRPSEPPPIYVSGFGPRATELAARAGDGFVNVVPEGDALERYRKAGGKGPAIANVKVCYDPDEAAARKLASALWPTSALPGQLNQELAVPAHFEQAVQLVTEDQVAASITCGPDPERHATAIRDYLEAGYDEVYVGQVGKNQTGFCQFFASEVRPRLGL